MTRDEAFPSKYLKVADLKGKPSVVVIESAPYETLKSLDGKETQKIVLHFRNTEKAMPLNITNFDSVCEATGCPDSDDWPGQRIELFPAKTTMGGKTVDCIRIRRPSVNKPQSSMSREAKVIAELDEDTSDDVAMAAQRHPVLDDEIPF